MKLQISFDINDLEKAIQIAKQVEPFADILEISSQLLMIHGTSAIKKFKKNFPNKEIFADTKLVDRVEPIIKEYTKLGINSISVLAGTTNNIIQNTTKIAHENKCLVALDLVDSKSIGQSAMDSRALDIDRIIYHQPHKSKNVGKLLEEWENVVGNTKTPIFIAGEIKLEIIPSILEIKPNGIIISSSIIQSENPAQKAEILKNLIKDD